MIICRNECLGLTGGKKMGALFSGISMIALLGYLIVFVLGIMFLYKGFIYFSRKVESDQQLIEKLDQLIEVLNKENQNK